MHKNKTIEWKKRSLDNSGSYLTKIYTYMSLVHIINKKLLEK